MKFILMLVAALGLTLVGGCAKEVAEFKAVYSVVTQAKISPQAFVVAASSFDAVEISATNYLRLRKCTPTSGPICHNPNLTDTIEGSIRAGQIARNNLKRFFRDHPDALGPKGDYDALIAASNTLKTALAAYTAATTK